MTTLAPTREARRPARRAFRLTSKVFWDMAIYMVGLGLVMGVIFPPFVVLLGVPDTIAGRPIFRLACLLAGFMVGAMNYALVKGVVGGRLTLLGGHLRSATDSITSATKSGDWSEAVFERIQRYAREVLEPAMKAIDPSTGIHFDIQASIPTLAPNDDPFLEAELLGLLGKSVAHRVPYGSEAGIFQKAGIPSMIIGPGDIADR